MLTKSRHIEYCPTDKEENHSCDKMEMLGREMHDLM